MKVTENRSKFNISQKKTSKTAKSTGSKDPGSRVPLFYQPSCITFVSNCQNPSWLRSAAASFFTTRLSHTRGGRNYVLWGGCLFQGWVPFPKSFSSSRHDSLVAKDGKFSPTLTPGKRKSEGPSCWLEWILEFRWK